MIFKTSREKATPREMDSDGLKWSVRDNVKKTRKTKSRQKLLCRMSNYELYNNCSLGSYLALLLYTVPQAVSGVDALF